MSLNKKNLTKMADELAMDKKLKFDRNELEKLLVKFSTLCNQKQLIDRNQFRDLLHDAFHMTEEILMDRVFRAFDEDMDGSISMRVTKRVENNFLKFFLKGLGRRPINIPAWCT